MSHAHQAVELAARESYGRLVAWLAARCGDLAKAQDALNDALEAALRTWPTKGVPDRPEAWLLTAARRRLIDTQRRAQTHDRATDRLQQEALEAESTPFRDGLPERRLELLFVCAHPDIPAAMRTPLMLQTVLGLDAKRIGSAFLVAPTTMGQRLVRAKRKVRDLDLPFELPPPAERAERVQHVLDAIYTAYGTGIDTHDERGATGLAGEAYWLAQLVVRLLPESAEALGLLALISYVEARRPARRQHGTFVPLHDQDPALWDVALLHEADKALWIAAKLHTSGRYQLEASIQSMHADRRRTGTTDWASLQYLYTLHTAQYGTLGGWLGYAATYCHHGDPADGLALLDRLPTDATERHQPHWAVRAALQRAAGLDDTDARAKAIGLCEDPAVRAWLAR